MLVNSLIAAIIISLLSLVGVIGFLFSKKVLNKISLMLVAFSTGALLGGAFFHLLPESSLGDKTLTGFVFVVVGILFFYFMERILKWRHCHHGGEKCEVHTFTYMSLVGDGIHNFIDGLIIVSSFSISFEVGLAATIAIASHEIPQELGDFGILIHGGFSKVKALVFNLLSALVAIAGVVIGYFLINNISNLSLILLPFAAGGFIYIAMADLMPELHKEESMKKSVFIFLMLVVGLAFMYLTKVMFE